MSKRSYWLDLFTGVTWNEFRQSGGNVSGFRQSRWTTVQKIKPEDYLLCYITGISRFIAVLEVTSQPYHDDSKIWLDENFPARMKVKPIVELTLETAVPVTELRDRLSFFKELETSSMAWTGHFRGSPARWLDSDGEAVVQALLEAKSNPVVRPVDERKLRYRPKPIRATIGSVTIPEADEEPPVEVAGPRAQTDHTEIQWLLLTLGGDMGFDLWVARNDKNREYDGHKFSQIPHLKKELPLQFDEATNRTIELIDVLWLKGNSIIAAFEVESTSSIYSGLLRMSDLLAMQPNLKIPLYLVASDSRRGKVMTEVNRPTFSRLDPPLFEVCRFISFDSLREQIKQVAPFIRHLKPEFLEEISESCELEEA